MRRFVVTAGAMAGTCLLCMVALAEEPCGAPDRPCVVEGGGYYVALPDDPAGAPVVLWLHGYASKGANAVGNASFAARYTDRGFALIAPDGQPDIGEASNLDWGVDDGHDWPRDDVAYLRAVLADAVPRFGLDGDRILAAGFSRGGSMIWDLACRAPEIATAFAAVSGAFWEPLPETCAGPAHIHHTHGVADTLVPVEGRAVAFHGFDYVQGNVFEGIEVWRRVDGCPGRADVRELEDGLWRLAWTECDAGSITLQLTTGGHGIPNGWAAQVMDWFATVSGDVAE